MVAAVADSRGSHALAFDALIAAVPCTAIAALGAFDAYLPRLEKYLATIKGYETNRYELSPDLKTEIGKRWG